MPRRIHRAQHTARHLQIQRLAHGAAQHECGLGSRNVRALADQIHAAQPLHGTSAQPGDQPVALGVGHRAVDQFETPPGLAEHFGHMARVSSVAAEYDRRHAGTVLGIVLDRAARDCRLVQYVRHRLGVIVAGLDRHRVEIRSDRRRVDFRRHQIAVVDQVGHRRPQHQHLENLAQPLPVGAAWGRGDAYQDSIRRRRDHSLPRPCDGVMRLVHDYYVRGEFVQPGHATRQGLN